MLVKHKRTECMQKEFQSSKGKSTADGYTAAATGVSFFLLRKETRVQSRLTFAMIHREYHLSDCASHIAQVFGSVSTPPRTTKRMLGKPFNFIFDPGKQMLKTLVPKLALTYRYKASTDSKRSPWVRAAAISGSGQKFIQLATVVIQ